MKTLRLIFLPLVLSATLALATSCGDENTTKALLTAGGAAGGAYAGYKLAPQGQSTLGMVMGGAAGGGLGYVAGGLAGGKK